VEVVRRSKKRSTQRAIWYTSAQVATPNVIIAMRIAEDYATAEHLSRR
jgi:hypothetical protein